MRQAGRTQKGQSAGGIIEVIYIPSVLYVFMEVSKYDKDSLVGISVFVAIASLVYFFLDMGWWITLLIAGLIALFADMRRLESDMRGDIKELGLI